MKLAASLPSLITFANILFGFASVTALLRAAEGASFGVAQAAWFIIIAAFLDSLDGKLARKMNRQSRFGMELDSLADVVSFGLAPSVLIYHVHFSGWFERGTFWGWLGIGISALPLLLGSYRLARFNTESAEESGDKGMFSGMPIPVNAGLLASFVLFNLAYWNQMQLTLLILPLVLVGSLLMVSRIPVDPMPRLSFRESGRNKVLLLLLLLTLAAVVVLQARVMFPIAMAYVLYCVIRHMAHSFRKSEDESEDLPDHSAF